MASASGRAALLAFAQTSDEWDDDCLRFYDLVLQYERSFDREGEGAAGALAGGVEGDEDGVLMLRRQIIEQFVVADSMHSIGISRRAREAAMRHWTRSDTTNGDGGDGGGERNMFDAAMEEVLELLREDGIWDEFARSGEYLRWIQGRQPR